MNSAVMLLAEWLPLSLVTDMIEPSRSARALAAYSLSAPTCICSPDQRRWQA